MQSAQEWRDQQPEKHARAMRDWQQRNRESLSEYQRRYRAENPEAYEKTLAATRERQKVQRRVKALGLPPPKKVRVKARDRRANESAAQEFFERDRAASTRKRVMSEYVPLDEAVLAGWRSRSALARRRDAQLSRFQRQLATGAPRVREIREEVRMDAVARRLRGDSLDAPAELRQRVFDAAGGREYLAAGGDRHTAALILEESLDGLTKPVTLPDGRGMVWVPEHTRAGGEVAGHWRRRAGG